MPKTITNLALLAAPLVILYAINLTLKSLEQECADSLKPLDQVLKKRNYKLPKFRLRKRRTKRRINVS